MKTEKITTPAIRLLNDDILIGINECGRYGKEYHVQIDTDIIIYNEEEMLKMYGVAPESLV